MDLVISRRKPNHDLTNIRLDWVLEEIYSTLYPIRRVWSISNERIQYMVINELNFQISGQSSNTLNRRQNNTHNSSRLFFFFALNPFISGLFGECLSRF